MSPVAIQGVDDQSVYVQGVQAKKTLSAANSIVNKGVYDATLLETVDVDLAVGNIIVGATIFGKVGAASPGTATHDIQNNSPTALVTDSNLGATQWYDDISVAGLGDVDIATLTQTYTAGSVAEAYGYILGTASGFNKLKLRLYMDGVQVAESAYIGSVNYFYLVVVNGYAALSGSKIVKIAVHNYDAGIYTLLLAGGTATGTACIAGVFSGSVKVV